MMTNDNVVAGAAVTASARERLERLRDEAWEDPEAIRAYEETEFRLELLGALRSARNDVGLRQGEVARRMATTQSAVSDLETGRVDAQLGTLHRYGRAIGKKLSFSLEDPASDTPPMGTVASPVMNPVVLRPVVGSLHKARKARDVQQIAADVNLPAHLVSAVLTNLTETRLAEIVGDGAERKFQLVPSRIIGISLHGDHMVGVLTDSKSKELLNEHSERTIRPGSSSPEDVLQLTFELVHDLYKESKEAAPAELILGVGVSVAGIVDVRRGEIVFAPDLLDQGHPWRNVHFEQALQDRIQRDIDEQMIVVIENDVNALALGAKSGPDDTWAAVLMSGAGIGSALMSDGRIIRGSNSSAGEIGHVIVDDSLGAPPCRAGLNHFGCLESVVSNRVLLRRLGLPADSSEARRASFESVNRTFDLKTPAGEFPKEVFEEAGRALGEALSRFDILDLKRVEIFASPFLCEKNRYASAKHFRAGVDYSLREWRKRERDGSAGTDVFRPVPKVSWKRLKSTAEASAAAGAFTLLAYFLDRPDIWSDRSIDRRAESRQTAPETDVEVVEAGAMIGC